MQYLDLFLEHLRVERHYSANTVEAYARDVGALSNYLAQRGSDLAGADTATLGRWLRHHASARSQRTQARALSSLRSFFRWLCQEGHREDNPALVLDHPKKPSRLPSPLSAPHVSELLGVFDGQSVTELRNRAVLELLYGCGLRVSELCLMTMDQVELNQRLVRPMGKGRKERLVPLGDHAARAIEAYLQSARPHYVRGATSRFLFPGRGAGKSIARSTVFRVVKLGLLKAGLDPKLGSPHALRHAFATDLLRGEADLRVVQELLGHADISTTEIYTHLSQKGVERTVQKHHPLGSG